MSENLMNQEHKASNQASRDGWKRTFVYDPRDPTDHRFDEPCPSCANEVQPCEFMGNCFKYRCSECSEVWYASEEAAGNRIQFPPSCFEGAPDV